MTQKNYWKDVIFPARKEMLAIIKCKVISIGGKLSYEFEQNPPVLCDYIEGERMFTLNQIVVEDGELFFDGSSAYTNHRWNETFVSTDCLCEIADEIDEVIERNENRED